MDKSLERIAAHAAAGLRMREEFFRLSSEKLRKAAFETALRLALGGKLLLCGNGGSAADAQHVAAEFVNRYKLDRPALPAIALTTDSSALTAIGNDSGYELVFARQLDALGRAGDVLLAISTSGNSPNVLAATALAQKKDIFTIGLTGPGGGEMAQFCDLLLDAPFPGTPLIQETHLAAEHIFCELVEYYLFENVGALTPFLDGRAKGEGNANI